MLLLLPLFKQLMLQPASDTTSCCCTGSRHQLQHKPKKTAAVTVSMILNNHAGRQATCVNVSQCPEPT
jgi:hypothetical protein